MEETSRDEVRGTNKDWCQSRDEGTVEEEKNRSGSRIKSSEKQNAIWKNLNKMEERLQVKDAVCAACVRRKRNREEEITTIRAHKTNHTGTRNCHRRLSCVLITQQQQHFEKFSIPTSPPLLPPPPPVPSNSCWSYIILRETLRKKRYQRQSEADRGARREECYRTHPLPWYNTQKHTLSHTFPNHSHGLNKHPHVDTQKHSFGNYAARVTFGIMMSQNCCDIRKTKRREKTLWPQMSCFALGEGGCTGSQKCSARAKGCECIYIC